MGDHAHHALALGEGFQRGSHHVQGVRIQGAESFVEEDGVQPGYTGCGEGRDLRRQRKSQRQGCLEISPPDKVRTDRRASASV